jgi:hypothetical protein
MQVSDYDYEYEHKHEHEIASHPYLPTLAGISHRREAFTKFCLLALGFPFLVCLACLLLGTRARSTAKQKEDER